MNASRLDTSSITGLFTLLIYIFKYYSFLLFRPSHPTGHDGINFSRVTAAQCHQISVKRPDSLKSKPDVTS